MGVLRKKVSSTNLMVSVILALLLPNFLFIFYGEDFQLLVQSVLEMITDEISGSSWFGLSVAAFLPAMLVNFVVAFVVVVLVRRYFFQKDIL